ncbi:MAG TPA: class I SAM-dependent methyltransferase [Paracoccaceae bacterium]|nr:class I SAM-dependent methyltransferase [Paracoccaceae bacterium]
MSRAPEDTVIATYEAHAEELRSRYDQVATEDVLSPVFDLMPTQANILEVGAGSGRDTCWLADRGHAVTAVEPVAAFREAIVARAPNATVVDARLPCLAAVTGSFDLILVNAVWHHLPETSRKSSFARLAKLLQPGGRLFLSLRHGPAAPGQPVHILNPDAEILQAKAGRLRLLRRVAAPSRQKVNIAAGVTWIWLVFEKERLK